MNIKLIPHTIIVISLLILSACESATIQRLDGGPSINPYEYPPYYGFPMYKGDRLVSAP